jgi:branched-chain amino acid transport system permease protein
LGTILLIGGFQALTIYGSQYALVVMGVLLVITVLLAPEGLVMALALLPQRLLKRGAREAL